ncbi:hypothetical protein P691DRAFT_254637 [Macrolepiota fuliginosa MF-IS2]|uniref:Uncharacterized protein n=1 Tax=Macrolepiota fuliginosa MF-IS2 TaxID=1400762 RepID=A0A9P5X8L4_9AGAR|nr:hypothetical protein P691DRAFT_254637 [Macrolepiota fuliginosa MF-IS2]
MILDDNNQPIISGTTHPTRQDSTSTTSPPPPYESTGASAPLISDEKRHHEEPPAAFSRVSALSTQALTPFSPMTVLVEGSGRALDKGFSLSLPLSSEATHPFKQRDITDADWTRFMQDLRDRTAFPNSQKNSTFIIPIALGLGPGAFFISNAIKAKIRRKKLAHAIALINTWNQNFFGPRQVEIILMRGTRALTQSKSNYAKTQDVSQNNHSAESLSSSDSSSPSSPPDNESKGGCCGQPKIPMKLVVVAL